MTNSSFLLGVDLEDTSYGNKVNKSFEIIVLSLLDFFERNKMFTTFFVLGITAERYPELVKLIFEKGHEIACHSYNHRPLSKLSKKEFTDDLKKNIFILNKNGVTNITGYRAPYLSLTKECTWVYQVLNEQGIKYSSSVLPAINPLYGWNKFGSEIKRINNSVIELPVSLNFFQLPIGGVYFRFIPFYINKLNIRYLLNNKKVLISYIHPYDIDITSSNYRFSNMNSFYNWLMYYNREKLLNKLEEIVTSFNLKIIPYREFLKDYETDHSTQ